MKEYESHSNLVRVRTTTRRWSKIEEYSSIRPLIDWLDYNGYTVVSKPAKELDDGEGRRKIKRSMSVEIAVDVLELSNHVDHIVLFSGDGDFRPLLEAVQRRGVHVTVVSPSLSMISDELRRQADVFIDLPKTKVLNSTRSLRASAAAHIALNLPTLTPALASRVDGALARTF